MSTNPMQKSQLSALIKTTAAELGFSACGIAQAEPLEADVQQNLLNGLYRGFRGI